MFLHICFDDLNKRLPIPTMVLDFTTGLFVFSSFNFLNLFPVNHYIFAFIFNLNFNLYLLVID